MGVNHPAAPHLGLKSSHVPLTPRGNMCSAQAYVRFVPIADILLLASQSGCCHGTFAMNR